MSVSGHLSISVDEYDARIRTFVPYYDQMLDVVADTVRLLADAPSILDLGIGTGALSAQCLKSQPNARIIGIDADPAMLEVARHRLAKHPHVELQVGNFLKEDLPASDVIIACISLHHISDPATKQKLYENCRRALKPGGMLVSADCFPAKDQQLAAEQREKWIVLMQQWYSRAEAENHLASWAEEDTYFPLEDEMAWLRSAGLVSEVVWRKDSFAVIAGRK